MEEKNVGRSTARVDGVAKVTGQTKFPGDLTMPGTVHMKVVFARRPHARIVHIDTRRAESAPGVIAVLIAKDVPVNSYGIAEYDQPVLCEDIVRFVGDRIALVVADSENLAAAAAALVGVTYQDLPILDSPEAALTPDAPLLHPDKGSNVVASYRIRKGDTVLGFAQADVVVEQAYWVSAQEHAYLQPDAGLAWVEKDGSVVVMTGGQWAHDDRRQIAHSLGLPEDRVRVIYTHVGGSFGGREDISIQILVALAAMRLGVPVKVVWSREEVTIGHHKRHPMLIKHRWGATQEGKLTAQQIEIVADGGAYASTSAAVLGAAVLACTGPYEVHNVNVDARAVYTNNIPGGAMRGFGAPQANFAAELQMSHLAHELNMDPVELRMRNLLNNNSLTHTNARMPAGVSTRETLSAAALKLGWQVTEGAWCRRSSGKEARPGVLRGTGIASGWKNIGYVFGFPEQVNVTIELFGTTRVERAVVRLAASEVGQGIHTTIKQMAADALQLSHENIDMVFGDTAVTLSAGSVSASRMTLMAGNAIRRAADAALQAWQNEERPVSVTYTYEPRKTEPLDSETGRGEAVFAYGYLAQGVDLEVDTETGELNVRRIVAVHDVGRAINPQIVEGQIEGGAIQALGWATIENFLTNKCEVLTPTLATYLVPTIPDTPQCFDMTVLENPVPFGPWGCTGVGEMPFLSIAPAVADALHDATGVWYNRIPLTPEKVLQGLKSCQSHNPPT